MEDQCDMKYDAFISYRHGELDGLVAEKLHKMLETYRIPRVIAKKVGKKKLTRVFRDREELPTSSNLSDSINDALENSDFLLLICSRRTCESMWVMREVERFGELHGKDKIVTLLIDGEPDESFPPGLREREVGGETIFVEPLAADIRDETQAGSIKKLKEEKLRLLAPVLGCAFDDLRRRHQRRRTRRIVSVAGAIIAFSLSFGAFSSYQYWQIDRQMQLKLENQSYVLSEYSTALLADGDPETATLLALAALPDDLAKPERPLVAAAEKALADAMGIYDVRGGYKSHKVLGLPAAPGRLLLSPGETYTVVLYPYSLDVFDTESGEKLYTQQTVHSTLADVLFLSDDTLVFAGEKGITAYDIALGRELWTGRPATGIAVSGDGTKIAAVYKDEGTAWLYSPDGKELGSIDFSGKKMRIPVNDSFSQTRDTLFALSRNGGRLGLSFDDGSVCIFDTQSRESTEIFPARGAIHVDGGFFDDVLAFAPVETDPYNAGFLLFDTGNMSYIQQYSSGQSHFTVYINPDGIYLTHEDKAFSVDTTTGELSTVALAGGRIIAFAKSGKAFLICESGGLYRFPGDGEQIYQSDYACQLAALGERYALVGGYDSKTIRILKKADLSTSEIMTYDSLYSFSEAGINPETDRAVFYSYLGMRVTDLGGKVLAEIDFPQEPTVIDTQYDRSSGNVAVIYESVFRLYSGLDGSLITEVFGKQGVRSVIYTPFGLGLLDAGGAAALYDLKTGESLIEITADVSAERALALENGKLLMEKDGAVFYDGREIGAGGIIGAALIDANTYAFAISDGAVGRAFTSSLRDGQLTESFTFEAHGQAEAYFGGGYVFISPLNGDAAAYRLDGFFVRAFTEKGYIAEVLTVGDYLAANYISASLERYTFLLKPDSLETIAYLPGYLGYMLDKDDTKLILDSGRSLNAVKLYDTQMLMQLARDRLKDRALGPDELTKYKAG